MTPEQWQQARALFESALTKAPAERDTFLVAACGESPELLAEMRNLLRAQEQAGSFIEKPVVGGFRKLLTITKQTFTSANKNGSLEVPNTKHWFFWLTIGAGVYFLCFWLFAGVMSYKYFALDKYGFRVSAEANGQYVMSVNPQGPANGKLQKGDKILAFNDDTRYSKSKLLYWLRATPEGQIYTLRIARNRDEQTVELNTTPFPASEPIREQRWMRMAAYIPRSIVFVIVALLIGLMKPNEKQARIMTISNLTLASFALVWTLQSFNHQFSPFEYHFISFFWLFPGDIWFASIGYHAMYSFPPGVAEGRFWSALKWILYIASALLFINWVIEIIFTQSGQLTSLFLSYTPINLFIWSYYQWFRTIGIASIAAVILRNKLLVKNPEQRRRSNLVLYGTLISVLPQVVVELVSLPNTLQWVAELFVLLIPITFGYAILKRQVYDIHIVIRRGIQYLLAKNALRMLLVLPVIGLLLTVYANRDRTLADILFRNSFWFYALLLATLALSLAYRRTLRDWIDRRFFREAYQQDKILRQLIDEVKHADSMLDVSRIVSEKVTIALHPERLYLFYREGEQRGLSLGYSSGGQGEHLRLPEEFELLRFIELHGGAQDFPFPHKTNLPPQEKEWLNELGTKLVVPMNVTDNRLAGLLLLGAKKSEAPYSGSDRDLLETLADQIAIVYENVRLKDRVAKDRQIQHDVLARVEKRQFNLLKECPECGACYDSAMQLCAKDNYELTLTLPVERTIEARYRLDLLLGKGGMGAVYEAMDVRLNRKVAVKILSGSNFGNNEALRRFEREAKSSARLSHPNIITVYDYGVLNTEGAYLVMERLYGETLGALLRRENQLAPELTAEWFNQVLSAMKAAHQAGVIHRDLKPDNIFIVGVEKRPRTIKILDFGLAKLMQADGTARSGIDSMTTPGTIMGTLGYMSPEQLTGGIIDERSDIFSLGVIAVQMLTGQRPFQGKTYQELLTAILTQPFHLPGSSPETKDLEAALQKCLAKDKHKRYNSVAEMQAELIPILWRSRSPRTSDLETSEGETAILKT